MNFRLCQFPEENLDLQGGYIYFCNSACSQQDMTNILVSEIYGRTIPRVFKKGQSFFLKQLLLEKIFTAMRVERSLRLLLLYIYKEK
jgi:hypothetical protein